MKFDIMDGNKIIREEPIIGGWYCGFMERFDPRTNETYYSGEAIAQYFGDGKFYDEGNEEPIYMGEYNYLVFQNMGQI